MKIDRRFIIPIALSAIAGNASMLSFATESGAASVLVNVGATVVTPVTVTEQLFANISQGGSGGTITMSIGGTRSAGANASVLIQDVKSSQVTFNITGGGNDIFAVTLPSNASLNGASAGDIAAGTLNGGPVGTGNLTGGNKPLQVVVKLNPEDTKASTDTAGSVNITIDYN